MLEQLGAVVEVEVSEVRQNLEAGRRERERIGRTLKVCVCKLS